MQYTNSVKLWHSQTSYYTTAGDVNVQTTGITIQKDW